MKTLAKIVAALVIVVVVLVAAAAVLVPMFFDPNDHKERLAAAVKEHTGRTLSIPGDIGLTVFPWLGLELGAVELGNAPGFSAPTFARTEKVNVRLKLIPLLSRKVEMDTVTIHGLTLNLERNPQGVTNLDNLAGEKKPTPKGSGDVAGDIGLASIAIGGLDLRDANVSWKDAQSGQSYQISNLRAQTGALALGRPVDMELGFDLAGGKPALAGRVDLSGKLASNGQVHELSGLVLEVGLKGEQLPNGTLDAKLSAGVTADLAQQTADVRALEVTVGDLKLTGAVAVTKLNTAPAYKGSFEVAQFDVKSLMKSFNVVPPKTADSKALSSASLSFDAAGTPSRIALNPLRVTLDDSALTGKVEVVDFSTGALRFDLDVDAIDADRYLPPKAEGSPTPTPGTAAAGAGEIPLATLRGLNVDGTARIGTLKISNLALSSLIMTLKAKDGLIRLNPLGAKLYEGSYAGDVTVDARGNVPSISVNEKLTGVQAGPLLTDLQGQDRLTGTMAVVAALTAKGSRVEAMKETLNGQIQFAFTDGALKGINLAQMLREAKAKLSGGSAAQSAGPNQTDFSELGGTIDVTNGLATNNDLSAKSPFLRISGKGQAHLVKETIDYRVTASVVTTGAGQGGADLKDIAGLDVPVRVTGTFTEPRYGLDFEALASAFAKSKVGDLVNRQKEAITEKATDAIKAKVGGLTGGAAPKDAAGDGDAAQKVTGALKGLFEKK